MQLNFKVKEFCSVLLIITPDKFFDKDKMYKYMLKFLNQNIHIIKYQHRKNTFRHISIN